MKAETIIELINESRYRDYDEQENWQNLEDMGLSDRYKDILGKFSLVSSETQQNWESEVTCVWHFEDHNVYIRCDVTDGSYSTGWKLNTWTLKEVFPKKVETTFYE